MAIITGAMLRASSVNTVGLCHSVQVCATGLLRRVGMLKDVKELQWKTAGINHQGWLLEITDGGRDLYPEIKRRAAEMNLAARLPGGTKHGDMVRFEVMRHFGYYVTESSEHTAEYMPYWIKAQFPELIQEFQIPLDEYPRRCIRQIEDWKERSKQLVHDAELTHERTHEYGSQIMEAIETDVPMRIGGNVLNHELIPNLPSKAVVEIPCLVDRNGVQGCYVGEIPEQLAALNRTNINVQLLTIEAALSRSREAVYQAAMLDPHTASELTLDQIRALCDELLEAHHMESYFK
jgi:alpha-galactosidase